MLPKLPSDSFCWQRWRAGAHIWLKLGFRCRTQSMKDNADTLRQYAVGYIEGEKLYCRPKQGETAVLFYIDGVLGWTHLRNHEFKEVFK